MIENYQFSFTKVTALEVAKALRQTIKVENYF